LGSDSHRTGGIMAAVWFRDIPPHEQCTQYSYYAFTVLDYITPTLPRDTHAEY